MGASERALGEKSLSSSLWGRCRSLVPSHCFRSHTRPQQTRLQLGAGPWPVFSASGPETPRSVTHTPQVGVTSHDWVFGLGGRR